MNSAFRENIKAYGWKHGGLVSLQDNGFGDRVPSHHLLNYWDSLTNKQRQEFSSWESKYNTNTLIIRTSHFWDWEGLIDVMPTYKGVHQGNIDQMLENIQKKLHDPRLIEYAKNEWIDFRPEDCTISIAPFLGEGITTTTEHPNTPHRLFMIDDCELFSDYNVVPYHFFTAKDIPLDSISKGVRTDIDSIYEKIIWDKDITLQLESQKTERGGLLSTIYQIRKFVNRDVHSLYRTYRQEKYVSPQDRIFWTTSKEWTEETLKKSLSMNPQYSKEEFIRQEPYNTDWGERMPIVKVCKNTDILSWLEYCSDFESRNPEIPYIWFQASHYDTLNEESNFNQAKNIWIYFWISSTPALSHGHTRNIQQALKKSDGAVYISKFVEMSPIITKAISSYKKEFLVFVEPNTFPRASIM